MISNTREYSRKDQAASDQQGSKWDQEKKSS